MIIGKQVGQVSTDFPKILISRIENSLSTYFYLYYYSPKVWELCCLCAVKFIQWYKNLFSAELQMYVYLKTKSKSLYRYTASAYYETDGVGMAYMWQIKLLSHHENKTQLLMSLRVRWIIKLFVKSEANKWWPFGSGGWILIPNQTPDKTPLGFHLRWNMFFISVRSNTCILMRCFYYRVTKLVETTTTKIIIIIINSY